MTYTFLAAVLSMVAATSVGDVCVCVYVGCTVTLNTTPNFKCWLVCDLAAVFVMVHKPMIAPDATHGFYISDQAISNSVLYHTTGFENVHCDWHHHK